MRRRARFETAIEVGHIFKLGTRYSEPLGATFLDEDGDEKPLVMGSYGIGPGRIMAALVEQRHDEHGIAGWPRSVAPYEVHVVVLPGLEGEADGVAAALEAAGASVLLDDRDIRRGGEVRRRRPDRLPAPRHGREEDSGGRRGRRP